METVKVPGTAAMSFDGAGVESWAVTIPPAFSMSGTLLDQLIQYCAAQGLTFSAQFSYLGIV